MHRFPILIVILLALPTLLTQTGCASCPRAVGAHLTPVLSARLRERSDLPRPEWSLWLLWRADEASIQTTMEVCHG